jgi:hypothetical protein
MGMCTNLLFPVVMAGARPSRRSRQYSADWSGMPGAAPGLTEKLAFSYHFWRGKLNTGSVFADFG